ncbi:MAG: hypothetical protein ACLUHE_08015 [Christensenellales bacterium]
MSILLYNHSGCENRGCEAIVALHLRAACARRARSNDSHDSDRPNWIGGLNLPDVAQDCSLNRFRRTASSRLIEFDRLSAGHAARA